MSEQNKIETQEQITEEPEVKVEKIKDPKKVAAGKRLAEYHKKAKKALQESKTEENASSWMPDINFTTVIGVAGIGLTAFDLYMRYHKPTVTTTEKKPTTTPESSSTASETKEVRHKSLME